MNWGDVLKAVIPIVVASLAWLLGQVGSLNNRLINVESKMPALVNSDGIVSDSPISAERRAELREKLQNQIGELNVRIRLLEAREQNEPHHP